MLTCEHIATHARRMSPGITDKTAHAIASRIHPFVPESVLPVPLPDEYHHIPEWHEYQRAYGIMAKWLHASIPIDYTGMVVRSVTLYQWRHAVACLEIVRLYHATQGGAEAGARTTNATMLAILAVSAHHPCAKHQAGVNLHIANLHNALQQARQEIEAAQYALAHSGLGMDDGPTMAALEDVQRHVSDATNDIAFLPATARAERAHGLASWPTDSPRTASRAELLPVVHKH